MIAPPPAAAVRPFAFPPQHRMRRPAEFKRVYASGRRFGNDFFSVNVFVSTDTRARLGLSVAARVLRRAVDRNRVRRVTRESFRQRSSQLPSVDIIIGVRPAVRTATAEQLRAALDSLWKKIASACASS